MLFWSPGPVVPGILIYFRWGAIYIKWHAVCGRAQRHGSQFSGFADMAVLGVASLSLVGGFKPRTRRYEANLFRFYFVILSIKPEIRPRKRPTELVMHMDLVGGNEREGRVARPGPE